MLLKDAALIEAVERFHPNVPTTTVRIRPGASSRAGGPPATIALQRAVAKHERRRAADAAGVTRVGPTVRARVEEAIATAGVPGIVLAVAAADGARRCSASAPTRTGGPLGADSLFPVASVTKLATALCLLRLHDLGRLDLDAPAGGAPAGRGGRRPARDARRTCSATSAACRSTSPAGWRPTRPGSTGRRSPAPASRPPLGRAAAGARPVLERRLRTARDRGRAGDRPRLRRGLLDELVLGPARGRGLPRRSARCRGRRAHDRTCAGARPGPRSSRSTRPSGAALAHALGRAGHDRRGGAAAWSGASRRRLPAAGARARATSDQTGGLAGGFGGPAALGPVALGARPGAARQKAAATGRRRAPARAAFGHASASGCLAWRDPRARPELGADRHAHGRQRLAAAAAAARSGGAAGGGR